MESRPWQNWRYEISIINGCCIKGEQDATHSAKIGSCFNNLDKSIKFLYKLDLHRFNNALKAAPEIVELEATRGDG